MVPTIIPNIDLPQPSMESVRPLARMIKREQPIVSLGSHALKLNTTTTYPPFNYTKYLILMRANNSNQSANHQSLVSILQRLKDKSIDNDTTMEHDLRQHLEGLNDLQRTGSDGSSSDHLVFARYNLLETIIIGTVAAILTLLTIVGNIMVLISFRIDTQLQTVSNYFLMSLAVADLTIGVISMPLYTIFVLMGYWPFGPILCDIYLAIDYLMSNASVLNLLAISLDRYFSVIRPLTYRASRTPKRAGIMIGLAWIISLVEWPPWIIAYPYIEGKRTVPPNDCYIQFIKTNPYLTTGTAIAAFYLPVTIMSILYYGVWRETQKRQKDLPYLQGEKNVSKKSSSSDDNSSHQSTANNLTMARTDMTIGAKGMARSLQVQTKDYYNKGNSVNDKIPSIKRHLLPVPHTGLDASDIESHKGGLSNFKKQSLTGFGQILRAYWYRCLNCLSVDKEVIEGNEDDDDYVSDQISATPVQMEDNNLIARSYNNNYLRTVRDSYTEKLEGGGKLAYSLISPSSDSMRVSKFGDKGTQPLDLRNEVENDTLISTRTYQNKSICETSLNNFDGYLEPKAQDAYGETIKKETEPNNKRSSVDNNTYTIIIRLPDKGSSIYNSHNKGSIRMIKYMPKWCRPSESKINSRVIDSSLQRLTLGDVSPKAYTQEMTLDESFTGKTPKIIESVCDEDDPYRIKDMTGSTSFYKIPLSSTKDIFKRPPSYQSSTDRLSIKTSGLDDSSKPDDIVLKNIIVQPYARIVTKTVTNGPECYNRDSPIPGIKSTSKNNHVTGELGRLSPLKNCYLIRQVVEDTTIHNHKSTDNGVYPNYKKSALARDVMNKESSFNHIHVAGDDLSSYQFPCYDSTIHQNNQLKSPINSCAHVHNGHDYTAQSLGNHKHFYPNELRDGSPQPSTHLYSITTHEPALNSSCYTMASYIIDNASGEVNGQQNASTNIKDQQDVQNDIVPRRSFSKSSIERPVPAFHGLTQVSPPDFEQSDFKNYITKSPAQVKNHESGKKALLKIRRPDNCSLSRRGFNLNLLPMKGALNLGSSSNRVLLYLKGRTDSSQNTISKGKKVTKSQPISITATNTIIENRGSVSKRLLLPQPSPPISTMGPPTKFFLSNKGTPSDFEDNKLPQNLTVSKSKLVRNTINPLTNQTATTLPNLITSASGGPLLIRVPKSDKSRKRRIEKKQDKKAAKTLTAILLAFIITWTPYSVLVLIGAFCLNCVPESLWAFSYYLCYINSTVNPVCYAMCNANFRRNFKRILCCQFQKKKPPPRSRAHFLANRNNPMYNDLRQLAGSQTQSLK